MENDELKKTLETLLFITDQPLSAAKLAQTVGEKDTERVGALIAELQRDYEEGARALQVVEIAEGFQFATRPAFAEHVRKLYSERMAMRLSTAALETLSIIAYKQPLTRAEIEEIRGVEVIAALETLLEKRLVKVVGRKESVGRPLLYGTTAEFLRHFGLRGLGDLPPIDSFHLPEAAVTEEVAPAGPFAGSAELADAQGRPSPEGAEAVQGSSSLEDGAPTEAPASPEASGAEEVPSSAEERSSEDGRVGDPGEATSVPEPVGSASEPPVPEVGSESSDAEVLEDRGSL